VRQKLEVRSEKLEVRSGKLGVRIWKLETGQPFPF
jgi:hypothetical protein